MTLVYKLLLASASVFAVVASADKCYKEGERCIGAPGFPAVPYYKCCGGLDCTAKDTSYNGYGLVCEKKYAGGPKCYKEGERCIGAPGFPAVPYHNCCNGMQCTAKDTSYNGYGLVCEKKGSEPLTGGPKCYKEGERCIGAPGYNAVPYHPCCDGECSAKDTSPGGYGLVCKRQTKGPKCYKEGERCMGATGYTAVPYYPCCDGECSVKDTSPGGYGMLCGKVYATLPPPPPKCLKEGEECKKGSGINCCGKNKCLKGVGKYEYVCGRKSTMPPTTTAPKCIEKGKECKKDSGYMCCGKYKCVKGSGSYEFECGEKAPKCIKKGEECKKDIGDRCCKDYKCVKGVGKYDYECGMVQTTVPITTTTTSTTTTTTTTTTTAKCSSEGELCGKGYDACCIETECKKVKRYNFELRCVSKSEN